MPYADPIAQRDFQRKWKASTKEWFWELKKQMSCERCGFSHPATIQFHHKGNKTEGVSRMVNKAVGKDKILAEIDKCEVLCANCHLIHHNEVDYMPSRGLRN